MSSMQIHEAAVNRFFRSPNGPMGRYVALRGEQIFAFAFDNAAPHFRSGDMTAEFERTAVHSDGESVEMRVGTDARHPWEGHEAFNYPIALELGGVTPQGNYYRYPFLGPAAEAAGFRKVG